MERLKGIRSVNIARLLYLLICELAGAAMANHIGGSEKIWIGVIGGLLLAMFFILVESLTKKFTLRGFSNATVGLLIGVFCAWLLSRGLVKLIEATLLGKIDQLEAVTLVINASLYASLGFLGSVLALRSGRDDFSLLIPYIRFHQESAPGPPLLLDIDIITDSRLYKILNTGFIDGNLVIPRFVFEDLHIMANSDTASKKARGERGLQVLERLQGSSKFQITIQDSEPDEESDTTDARLLFICRLVGARLLTADEALAKTARLQGVKALNINDLNHALKPKIAVGERIRLPLVRTGKDESQAVGYLPDGSMIVVNNASNKLNTTQDVTVISTLETDAGTMVFAELINTEVN
jgi:uncharacterized protein YacL